MEPTQPADGANSATVVSPPKSAKPAPGAGGGQPTDLTGAAVWRARLRRAASFRADVAAAFRANLGLGVRNARTNSVTVYLRPPEQQKRRRKRTAAREISDLAFRYRVQLLPFLGLLWVALLAGVVAGRSVNKAEVLIVYLSIACWLLKYGYRAKLYRPVERWYAATVPVAAAVWTVAATWNGQRPTPHSLLVAVLLTGLISAPWWYHRRSRGTVPVRMDNLSRPEQTQRIGEARKLVREWTAFTSAGQLSGAKVQAITYNPWSVAIAVALRRGATVGEFTLRRLQKLESAFGDTKAGSARVDRVDKHARLAVVRFMLADPHEFPIEPPETGQTDIERIVLGLFETGEEVLFLLVNTLIGGMTGSGKSGVVNVLIRALARIDRVAILGIDMKPGAPEFGRWRGVMHKLATNAQEAADLLDRLIEGFTYRGQIMEQQRTRVWKPTVAQPFIVLLVDEVQELKAAGLAKKLDRVIALARAYGACVIVATQYPTRQNVSPTVKENCPQKIGLLTEGATADRVIFGEGATRERWSPSTIPADRQGSFFLRSPEYKRPLLGRAYWISDEAIDAEAERWTPHRTEIDNGTWPLTRSNRPQVGTSVQPDAAHSGGGQPDRAVADDELVAIEGPGPDGQTDADEVGEVVDAIIVDDDPNEELLRLLGTPSPDGKEGWRPIDLGATLDLSRATVYRKLAQLAEKGLASNIGKGRWVKE